MTRPGNPAAIPITCGSSALRTAMPSSGSAATRALFSAATPSSVRKALWWSRPILVTTAICGRTSCAISATLPGRHAATSTTQNASLAPRPQDELRRTGEHGSSRRGVATVPGPRIATIERLRRRLAGAAGDPDERRPVEPSPLRARRCPTASRRTALAETVLAGQVATARRACAVAANRLGY